MRFPPLGVFCAAILFALGLTAPLGAQPAAQTIVLELNKLEQVDSACRAYLVVQNPRAEAFDSLDLDLVTFQPDGVIGARFRIELAPVPAAKTLVKSFDFEGVSCLEIERVLLNDVVDCTPLTRPACLDALKLSTLNRDFFK